MRCLRNWRKEAITLFDRNVITIDMNDKAAGLWEKDMTGIKVRDRFDVQPVDDGAIIKEFYAADIKEEGYIRTDTDEFVIKQVEPSGEWYKCTGTLNVEELEGKQYPQGFETVEKTVDECLTEAIDGTGWKVIRCDVSKKRTIRIEQNCSAWDVAQQAITTYRCEMVFDSLNKGISVYIITIATV